MRVALLYNRYRPMDEQVVQFVEKHLTANGFEIYSEGDVPVGVSWAKEIEARICNSDAVIPFLSTGTLQSEMFVYQLELAHEAAQRQNGRPRLLPVCIQSPGPAAGDGCVDPGFAASVRLARPGR